MHCTYIDYAATAPVRESVFEAMRPYAAGLALNPSSLHIFGRKARRVLEEARERIAFAIEGDSGYLLFTSSASEANNAVLHAVTLAGPRSKPGNIVVSAVEHPSVLKTARVLSARCGVELRIARVQTSGAVDVEHLETLLDSDTRLVSVHHVNNEIGVIQPLDQVAYLCRVHGIPLHVDASQSLGKIEVSSEKLGATFVTLSAHKIGGPVGIGALWVSREFPFTPMVLGGNQQGGKRAGTEPVALAVGFAAAVEEAIAERSALYERAVQFRTVMLEYWKRKLPDLYVFSPEDRSRAVPHILNVGYPGIEGERVMYALDAAGIAVSTGAACSSGSVEPSPVLLATGRSHDEAVTAVRFSVGYATTEEEVLRAREAFCDVIYRLREQSVVLSNVDDAYVGSVPNGHA